MISEGKVLRKMYMCLEVTNSYKVSVGVADMDLHRFKVVEFQDNKFLVSTEALLLQLFPDTEEEVDLQILLMFPSKQDVADKVKTLLQLLELRWSCGYYPELISLPQNKELLNCLLKQSINFYLKKSLGFENSLNLSQYLCFKFKLTEDRTNHGVFSIVTIDLEDHMRLDINAVTALNLAPRKEYRSFKEKCNDLSIYGLIDTCKTKMGPRTLRRWILQPMVDRHRIEDRLDIVEYLVANQSIYSFLTTSYLCNITDLDRIATNLFKINHLKSADKKLEDVVKLYQAVRLTIGTYSYLKNQFDIDMEKSIQLNSDRKMVDELQGQESRGFAPSREDNPHSHRLSTVLECFNRILALFNKYTEMVEKHIDLSMLQRGEFVVNYSSSPELHELEGLLKDKRNQISTITLNVKRELQVNVVEERDGARYFILRVPKKAEKLIGKNSYRIVTTRANHMTLSTNELKKLSEEYIEIEDKYFAAQAEAAGKVVDILSSYYPAVEELAEFLGELDAVCALSFFSRSTLVTNMTRPKFTDGRKIVLRGSRHPILDRTRPKETVSNDCVMERGYSSFHIITGPNMGGKSTFIRQVAVNVILAQIGCFCCANYAELPIFDSVVTRVGAGDAQTKGLSTWMSELLEVSCMIDSATDRTLLVIDELGRGTSTSEGIGMTYSIAEHIINRLDSFCLFATHFFELTKLADEFAAAKNFHVEADIKGDEVMMSYKIKPGSTNRSYGINILSMLHFPESITEFATDLSKVFTSETFQVGPNECSNSVFHTAQGTASFDAKVLLLKMYHQAKNRVQNKSKSREFAEEELKERMELMLLDE